MTFSADLALAYLRELSADYRAGVILDARGAVLAGDERLARAAREIATAGATGGAMAGGAGRVDDSGAVAIEAFEGTTDRGKVFAARSATHLVVITTGPLALSRVVHRDLATVLAGMGAESAQGSRPQRIPHGTVEALLDPSD